MAELAEQFWFYFALGFKDERIVAANGLQRTQQIHTLCHICPHSSEKKDLCGIAKKSLKTPPSPTRLLLLFTKIRKKQANPDVGV